MERLENGANLGPYRILHQIGAGGMARVYKAFQTNMERYVAIKVLPSDFADEPQFAKRFIQEARTIARLEHKNILPVYDFGEHNGTNYLVMRYLEGGTLKDVLLQGRLTLHDTLEITDQVCSALGYAHRQGVIHRDVKPANIIIDSEGAVYLTDFGIAKVVGSSSDLTGTGVAIGTPAYMAPEQAVGDQVDGRTDLYALGVVLYEMILGQVPFQADTPMAVLMAHMHDPLPLPTQVDPQLDYTIENVIIKTLAKEPENRYQDAGSLMAALHQAIDTATLESQKSTLIDLITEIRANRGQEPTVQRKRAGTDISDPQLLEKLEALYIDGLSAYWIKDWERARDRLSEVISIDPNYKDARVRLDEIEKQSQLAEWHQQAQEAIEEAQWQTAQGKLEKIISAAPNDQQAKEKLILVQKQVELANLYNQGEQLFQAGQWQAVLNIFERIHQLDADYPDPQNLYPQADEALKEQQRLDTIKVNYQQGLQALDNGDWQQAQTLFSQVNTQQPGYAESEQLLGRAEEELAQAEPTLLIQKSARKFKPWYGLVGLVAVLAVAAGIWFVISLGQEPAEKPLEASAMPTRTPAEDSTTSPKEKEDKVEPATTDLEQTEQGEPAQKSVKGYDDFSTPETQLNPDRWRLTCQAELVNGPENLIHEGHLQFLNIPDPGPDITGCKLFLTRGRRIPGEETGGLTADLFLEPQGGEKTSEVGLILETNLGVGHILTTFCGLFTPAESGDPERPIMARFSIVEHQNGEHQVHFHQEEYIQPQAWNNFQMQIEPELMAFRCQMGEQSLGVWLPEDPDLLRSAQFDRAIRAEWDPKTTALSMVDNVDLLPPRFIPPVECPEISDWAARYWDNPGLAGEPVICQDEGFPVHAWARRSPAPGIPNTFFSANFNKQMEFEAGHYTFRLSGDDGVRLWLDDELLIDEWQEQIFTDFHTEVDIPAGEHTLRVEYFQTIGEAHIELFVMRDGEFVFGFEPGCLPAPEGLVGWWPGDGNTANLVGGPAGEPLNGVSFSPGWIHEAFQFDPSGWEQGRGGAVHIPLPPEAEYLQDISIEAWVFLDPENPLHDQVQNFVDLGEKFRLGREADGRLLYSMHTMDGQYHFVRGPEPLPLGEWIHVVGTYTGGVMTLYKNAIPVADKQVGMELVPGGELLLSNPTEPLSGMLDEVSLYERGLTLGEVRLLYYLAGTHGKCK